MGTPPSRTRCMPGPRCPCAGAGSRPRASWPAGRAGRCPFTKVHRPEAAATSTRWPAHAHGSQRAARTARSTHHLPHDAQHGAAGLVRVVQVAHAVGQPGAQVKKHGGGAARHARVAVCGASAHCLVQPQHRTDAALRAAWRRRVRRRRQWRGGWWGRGPRCGRTSPCATARRHATLREPACTPCCNNPPACGLLLLSASSASNAATMCISEVPGLAKHTDTPPWRACLNSARAAVAGAPELLGGGRIAAMDEGASFQGPPRQCRRPSVRLGCGPQPRGEGREMCAVRRPRARPGHEGVWLLTCTNAARCHWVPSWTSCCGAVGLQQPARSASARRRKRADPNGRGSAGLKPGAC